MYLQNISPKCIDKLAMKIDRALLEEYMNTFYGYGNLKGKYWFIGMEEGGGNSIEEIISRLDIWKNAGKPTLLDNYQFHSLIRGAGDSTFDRFFKGDKSTYQKTWGGLIKLLLCYKGENELNLKDIKCYQSDELGRHDSENCLIELFPLPSPGITAFNYSKWTDIEYLKSRETYKQQLAEIRVQQLKTLISTHKPELVVFYSFSNDYIKSWSEISGINFESIQMESLDLNANTGAKIAFSGMTCFTVIYHPTYRGIGNNYYRNIGSLLKKYKQEQENVFNQSGLK